MFYLNDGENRVQKGPEVLSFLNLFLSLHNLVTSYHSELCDGSDAGQWAVMLIIAAANMLDTLTTPGVKDGIMVQFTKIMILAHIEATSK